MPIYKGTRHVLLGGLRAIKYLLRATFDAPDQSFSDGQVLDTPAEGVKDGQLTCVIKDGGLSISGNKLSFSVQETAVWGDLGCYSQAITRVFGIGLFWLENISTEQGHNIGFAKSAGIFASVDTEIAYIFHPTTLDRLWIYVGGIREGGDFSYFSSTDFHLAIILGGYDSGGIAWHSGQNKSQYMYGAAFFGKGGGIGDGVSWTLLWRTDQGNASPLYGTFSNYNASGTLDNFRVPDADLSAVLQPLVLDTFTDSDGTSLDAHTPEVGGGWTEQSGNWETQSNKARTATTGGAGIATFDAGVSDMLFDVTVTTPASGTTPGGLVVRYTDDNNYWYVKITPGTDGTDFELIEVNGGTPTTRASADVDWAASTAYKIRVIVDGNDYWKVYVDGTEKLSYTTANSFNATATKCGLKDEGDANFQFDNVAVFARTSGAYDAVLGSV